MRWYRQRKYGEQGLYEKLLASYSRHLAGFLDDRQALGQLFVVDIHDVLGLERSEVLLSDGKMLVGIGDSGLQLPIFNAAVRRVTAGGEAVQVAGKLRKLIGQGRSDLGWTKVWAPIMRGTHLYGMWLLGERKKRREFSSVHLGWLTTLARQAGVALKMLQYAEAEQQTAEEMQALYHQAVSTRETARGQLSRELHDGILQDFSAISRDLKIIQGRGDAPPEMDELVTRAKESIRALRAICYDLRPPFLTNNLVQALQALVEKVNLNTNAQVSIETDLETLALPEDSMVAIYRIVQESLNNTISHADASEVVVRMTEYPDRLRVTITDDGRGIDRSEDLGRFVPDGHFGLAGMRERAKIIAAELEIQSAKDYGTTVVLSIPKE